MPDEKTKRRIFNIHTSRMTLSDDVDLEDLIMSKDELSGADVKVLSSLGTLLPVLMLAARLSAPRQACLRFGKGA